MPWNVQGECAQFGGGTDDVYEDVWRGEYTGGINVS